MRIAVIGCGGIGGIIAAHLTRAGVDVLPVVGNEKIARAISTHGFRVQELEGQTWSVAPLRRPVLQLEASDGPLDLVICVTQNTTLDAALRSALPAMAPHALVVTCQNGLPEERARAVVGNRVIGCVVGWGASMVEPGLYKRTSKGGLQLGRSSAVSPAADATAALLEAVCETKVVPDLAGVRWSKLAINCVTTTFGAIGGTELGKLLSHRSIRRLALEVFAEVAAVAAAANVKIQPVAGTMEIDKIAITAQERGTMFGSPSLAYKHSLLMAVGFRYRRMRSSMLYALERGRPPEIDFLNGEIVRRGQALGVPTPVNAALVARVQAIVAGDAVPQLSALHQIVDRVVVGRAALAA